MILYAPIFCLLPGTPSCLFKIQNPFKEARNVKISTSHVDGHRPISIVYLSDSGDLKLAKILHFSLVTGLLEISVKFMEMDLSNLPHHYLGGYFRNLVLPQPPHTRRRKRSYILPPTHNMHNTQNTDCVKKYRVDVSQIFQVCLSTEI